PRARTLTAQPSLRISTGLWEGRRLVAGYCRCEAGRVDRPGALLANAGRFLKLRRFSRERFASSMAA
ncbi:hypothetical protein, partial [Haematobacter sp. UBA3484]